MGTPSQYGAQLFEDGASYIRGLGYTSQVDITRPANTTQYTAGDVVGAALAAFELTNAGPANGHLMITDFDLRFDINAIPSGMGIHRAHLYNAAPASNLADNAVFDLAAGDRSAYLGYIDLPLPVLMGSSLYAQPTPQLPKKVKMGATTSLWVYAQTLTTYTPVSATVMSARLNGISA